jgi:dTMP kinase
MGKGIFIVLDGLDGSGKSEMIKVLHNYLSENCNVLMTMEPSDGRYGKEIREILANEKDPQINGQKMLDLFIKDREEHLKNEVIPFLNKLNDGTNVVISDRYYYSTIAFQATQGLDVGMLIELNTEFLKPDVAFVMDIKPEVALERIKDREKEKFENIKFMTQLREKFLKLPELLTDNIKVIDASRSKDEVFEDIKKEVDKLL